MAHKLSFTTDALPERDRFPAFHEVMSQAYVPFDITDRSDDGRFRASLALERAGRVSIGRLAITPTGYERTPRLLRDGEDDLGVVMCMQGGACRSQHRGEFMLHAGEGLVLDSARPGKIYVQVASQFWVLKLPRRAITSLLPLSSNFSNVRLDRDPVASKLLAGYLQAGSAVDLHASVRAAQRYDEHIIDLIALAAGAEGDARHEAELRSGRTVRRDAILRAIEKYAANPNLNATSIALLLGITPRYVRLLLEETGRSFSEHLLERRLERAATLLRDPTHRHRNIAVIAFDCGFGDLSYFNRVFRRRFGATPTDLRREALHR